MEPDILAVLKQLRHDARLLANNLDDLQDKMMDLRLQSQLKDLEIEKLKAEIERLNSLVSSGTLPINTEELKEKIQKQRRGKNNV